MNKNKKLLLHACCAPCLSQSYIFVSGQDKWERVLPEEPHFDITVYYYNPNVHPKSEYQTRLAEVKRLCEIFKCPVIEGPYEPKKWFEDANPLADEPERGKRCQFCIGMRLDKVFEYAASHGFETVATTLTISPYKDARFIHSKGQELSEKYGVEYLKADFKKQEGYKKSIVLSKKYNLYRQHYCGCIYSKLEQERLSAQHLKETS